MYRDGGDSIGSHQDKLPTIGARPNDFIIILKLGRFGRPFALSKPKPTGATAFPAPFFEQQIDPGSLVVMSPYDNEFSVAHSVPETTCGRTSSLVIRNITHWMSEIDFAKKLAACRRGKDTRAKKRAKIEACHAANVASE